MNEFEVITPDVFVESIRNAFERVGMSHELTPYSSEEICWLMHGLTQQHRSGTGAILSPWQYYLEKMGGTSDDVLSMVYGFKYQQGCREVNSRNMGAVNQLIDQFSPGEWEMFSEIVRKYLGRLKYTDIAWLVLKDSRVEPQDSMQDVLEGAGVSIDSMCYGSMNMFWPWGWG